MNDTLKLLFKTGIVDREHKQFELTDEPRFSIYICKSVYSKNLNGTTFGSGIHLDPNTARMIACAECIERYCLGNYPQRDPNLLRLNGSDLNPIDPALFGIERGSRIDSSSSWWPVTEQSTGRLFHAPAEAIFVTNYNASCSAEYESNSTGAALGRRGEKRATTSGLLEVIERDAVIGTFLSQRQLHRVIDLPDGLSEVVENLNQYRLEASIYDVSNDLGVPTIMVALIDKTFGRPVLTTGSASRFTYREAIERALLESVQSRIARRLLFESHQPPSEVKQSDIETDFDRVVFWSNPDNLKLITQWLFTADTVPYSSLNPENTTTEELLRTLKEKQYPVYVADITPPSLSDLGLETRKVLVPALHRMHIRESSKQLISEHWGDLSKCSTSLPHPFA